MCQNKVRKRPKYQLQSRFHRNRLTCIYTAVGCGEEDIMQITIISHRPLNNSQEMITNLSKIMRYPTYVQSKKCPALRYATPSLSKISAWLERLPVVDRRFKCGWLFRHNRRKLSLAWFQRIQRNSTLAEPLSRTRNQRRRRNQRSRNN